MSTTESPVTLRHRTDAPDGPLVHEGPEKDAVAERTWFSDAVPSAARRSPFKGGPKIGMG